MKDWTKGLPGKIKVAAFDFTVEIRDGNWAASENKFGEFSCIEQAIRLQGDMSTKFKFLDTVLHEIGHAIWWAYGIEDEDKEERVVSTMGTAWTQVYRDNPELAQWIAKQVK